MNGALPFIAAAALLALTLGFVASRSKDMSLEQWTVGGRGFGAIFVFLLLAGEIYTTFTFLGGSGFAYGKGAPAYYILCYGTLAYVLSYFMLPPIWRYAKENGLYSQADFFVRKYDSPTLGVIVALVDIAALIPYLLLQFKGLGIIVEVAGYGAISSTLAIWIGAVIVAAYVMVSGVHGSCLDLGRQERNDPRHRGLPRHLSALSLLRRAGLDVRGDRPGQAGIHRAAAARESLWWFSSTVLLTALGFYMWPHSFGSIYTAKSATVIRKNAIVLPLYQLILLFVFLVGFAATLQVPGLTGSNIDLALFKLSVKSFDPWFVGVIGATGVLTALVPGSMILMTAATLIANNLYRAAHPSADDRQISRLAKLLVPLVALVAVFFTLKGGETIVALLLMGYSLVTQLVPSLLLSLARRNIATREGAAAGIIAGVSTVAAVSLTGANLHTLPWLPAQVQDLNIGIVALAVNFVVLILVSLAMRLAATPAHAAAG
jgi:solute:Na+ symporter, SSS family